MKIHHLLSLIILSLVLGGCTGQNQNKPDAKLIVADEKFCIAKTPSNISSDEAYQIAKQSECSKAGNVKEDCNCDNTTHTCSFTLETDKSDCHPLCVVNLKTGETEVDWRCGESSKAE